MRGLRRPCVFYCLIAAWMLVQAFSPQAQTPPFVPGRDDRLPPPGSAVPERSVGAVAFPESGTDLQDGSDFRSMSHAEVPPAFPDAAIREEDAGYASSSRQETVDFLNRIRETAPPEDYAKAVEFWPLAPEQLRDMPGIFTDACYHPDERVRLSARNALLDIPREQLFAYVMRTLSWGEADAVFSVDCMLPEIGPVIAPLLRKTLEAESEPERHRCVAAWALGRSGSGIASDLLCALALDATGDLARCCREALRYLRPPCAARVWIDLLENRPEEAGPDAITALDALGTLESENWIFEAACGRKNVGRYLEEVAVKCVARKDPIRAVPALIAVMEQNRGMREVAAKALRAVTGQPLGTDAGLWRVWYQEETGIMLPPPPQPPQKSPDEAVTPQPLEFPREQPPLLPAPDGTVPRASSAESSAPSQPGSARNPKSIGRKH